MRRHFSRWALAFAAAGMVGAALPIPAAQAEQQFGGYSTEATATPLKIEIYEPVIPIPAEPQAEMEFAYTKVEAASGPTGKGTASWLWPGDPLGQGWKTFLEAFGVPASDLEQERYPIQVNSEHPGGPERASDEPVPGSLMRTSADGRKIESVVGYSPDGDVSDDRDPGKAPDPGLPENPLGDLGAAITGKDRSSAEEPPSGPGMPPQLAALVDVDGMVSHSRTLTAGDTIRSVATSRLNDVSLLGGLVTADSIVVTTTGTSNGKRANATGVSRVVGLEFAGTPIAVNRGGVEVAGKKLPVSGLPDDPAKALEKLGVSLVAPKGRRSVGDGSGEATFEGLRIVIDTGPLRSQLDDVPFDDIIGLVPDEAAELKSLIGAATQLSPKFVITAGNAAATASTVPAIDFDLPSVDPSQLDGAGAPPVGTASGGSGTAAGPSGTAAPGLDAAGAGTAGGAAAEPTALASSTPGLPPLASIPGALMVGALVIASGVGWWLQKIGGFVLGGAGSCTHGLDTGIPDLRKA